MPEIKHQFTAGKMNKDLDERLVPNGEYRDAMNIQVSTSEDSNVGTVQNILGNSLVSGLPQNFIAEANAYCVGSIADEKNDAFYYFVDNVSNSCIIQHKNNTTTLVFVDINGGVLNFSKENIITGINIIDDMLFWTDNNYEPKKINIPRSIEGTDPGGLTHTNFINSKTGASVPAEEKHITVIKQAPAVAPKIEMYSERDPAFTYAGVIRTTEPYTGPSSNNQSSFELARYDFSGLKVGDFVRLNIETDINGDSGFILDWSAGDTILFKEFIDGQAPALPITNYTIKAVITEYFNPSGTENNRFTDTQNEEATNGDFVIPNTNGSKPLNYNFGSYATYDNVNSKIVVDTGTDPYKKVWFTEPVSWNTNDTYRITVTLSNVSANNQQGIRAYIVIPNSTAGQNDYYWFTDVIDANGTFTQDITLDINTASTTSNHSSYVNKFFIQNTGNVGFAGDIESISIVNLDASNARARFRVTDIASTPPIVAAGQGELRYALDKQETDDKLYEFKFPRFATRYKYQDGEYSVFSPFTPVAFLPGSFDYHPVKGYNIGMTNRLTSVDLRLDNNVFPDGVVLIDILYKEETSSNIYVLDSIKQNNWNSVYSITSETINRVVPSNQFLRPWDNVPKKALAQDVTGSRIVYANYEQGYDLIDQNENEYYPDITVDFESDSGNKTRPSVKSSREYQVGVAFIDQYGRETPVVVGQAGTSDAKRLNKEDANKQNKINVTFNNGNFMKDAKFFKFFVKETSGEYYNMAMDRFWDADDGHVWVSFPSSDVNKIDIDSYLVLKKGVNSNELIEDPARYKVIAIENEAPDFIKTKKALIDEKQHNLSTNNVFGNSLVNAPVSGVDNFKLNYTPFLNSAGSNIDLIDDGSIFYIEFTDVVGSFVSERYRINKIDTNWRHQSINPNDAAYFIKLDKNLGTDVDFISDGTKIKDDAIVRIYKYKKENSPEFDGRFFVKIINDSIFLENAYDNIDGPEVYRVSASKKLYYLKDNIATTHNTSRTGMDNGMYGATGGDFGRYAAFFRNYKHDASSEQINFSGTATDVGQYKFGDGDDWKTEFLNYTSSGTNNTGTGWDGAWNFSNNARVFTKIADRYPNISAEEEEVWFIDAGSYNGSVISTNNLDWDNVDQNNGTKSGIVSGGAQATLSLAIGGVYNEEISTNSDKVVDDFFSIGQNQFYNDADTTNLVLKLNTSIKFRFKEDPEQTIYTIQSFTDSRLLRYTDGSNTADPYPWSNSNRERAQFAPNFTRGWDLKIKNPNGNGGINWEPTGSLGAIGQDGLVISIDHSNTASTVASPEVAVVLDSLVGTNSDGSSQTIKVGMALVSHSNSVTTYTAGETDLDFLIVWKIEQQSSKYIVYLTGYSKVIPTTHDIYSTAPNTGETLVFKQPKMNGYSQFSANRLNQKSSRFSIASPGVYAVGYTIEFLQELEGDNKLPDNPAIWETEPKENTPLDVYYEASGLNPIVLQEDTKHLAIPTGSTISHLQNNSSVTNPTAISAIELDTNTNQWYIVVSEPTGLNPLVNTPYIVTGDNLRITRHDGSFIDVTVNGIKTSSGNRATEIYIDENLLSSSTSYTLNWHNCFSFGNGVESNRVRDTFNLPFISNGARVSTVLEDEEDYKSDRRKSGLIYSGVYNGIGGINSLNQFIAAEKITKDLNPTYGSIQKLHSRDSDLIALCEDKVVQILADKDAVFEADGNPQLTATNRVLGQSRPFVGEYGISNNPESFASESYRAYFTDKVRGAVMRLSKDGLTPISEAGMKDYFRDNLKNNSLLIGSYDDKKDEYNLTLPTTATTVSYKENVRGWVSFKSFVPENAISCANEYYTLKEGKLYKHHDESQDRNTFYDQSPVNSSFEVVLNDFSGSIKTFNTLDYEGSQSKIVQELGDNEFYNLSAKTGWHVTNITTDKQEGSISEFIEKEGKWFNYIKGVDFDLTSPDLAALNVQGLGIVSAINGNDITIDGQLNISLQVGDTLYHQTPVTASGFTTLASLELVGNVTAINGSNITLDAINTLVNGNYCMFVKNQVINSSSLVGYYANAKFENDSITKAELFSVGSEVTESSK